MRQRLFSVPNQRDQPFALERCPMNPFAAARRAAQVKPAFAAFERL
jgi:hypothetical protein